MNDLDPNYLLPLWRAVMQFFTRHPPVVHGYGLDHRPVPGAVTSLDIPVESLAAVRRAPLVQSDQRLDPPGSRRAHG